MVVYACWQQWVATVATRVCSHPKAGTQQPFSFIIQCRTPVCEKVLPYSGCVFLPQLNLSGSILTDMCILGNSKFSHVDSAD